MKRTLRPARRGPRAGRLVPALVAAALLGPAAAPAAELTFPEALARLKVANGTLRAAVAEVRQGEAERAAARGLYLPRVEAQGRATWIDAPITLDLDPIRQVILGLHPGVPAAAIPRFTDELQDDHFQRAELEATWVVFAGGRIGAANQAAAARLDDTRHGLRQTEQSVTSELVRRFFGLRLAYRALEVRRAVEAALVRHLEQARRLEAEGQLARAERLHAEVASADAERERRRAEHDVTTLRAGLAGLLADDDSLDAASPLFMLREAGPRDSFLTAALARNPGLSRLEARRALAGAAERAESSHWYPDVYLFGQRELLTGGLTVLDPRWAVGVGARWTLFEGFARPHRGAAARQAIERVDALAAQARHDVATLVTKRYEELQKARESFASLETGLAAAEENRRVRGAAFAEGMATSLDVVDAELALARLRLERLLAAYAYDVALADLLEAAGQSGRFEEFRQRADLEVES